jgi:hypothetical protein
MSHFVAITIQILINFLYSSKSSIKARFGTLFLTKGFYSNLLFIYFLINFSMLTLFYLLFLDYRFSLTNILKKVASNRCFD